MRNIVILLNFLLQWAILLHVMKLVFAIITYCKVVLCENWQQKKKQYDPLLCFTVIGMSKWHLIIYFCDGWIRFNHKHNFITLILKYIPNLSIDDASIYAWSLMLHWFNLTKSFCLVFKRKHLNILVKSYYTYNKIWLQNSEKKIIW